MLKVANGEIDAGDRVSYPGVRGQENGTVEKIVTIREFNGVPARRRTSYRVYVWRDSQGKHGRPSVLRNPGRIVKLRVLSGQEV